MTGVKHITAVDGLRAGAVGLVILTHALVPRAEGLGQAGVGLFFGLSGFLITSLLLAEQKRTGRIDLRAFYLRRLLRLAPALILMLAIVTPLYLAFGIAKEPVRSALLSMFYLGNWGQISGRGFDGLGHTWSLAVEEHFYLIWPLLVSALVLRRRWLVWLAALIATAAVLLRIALVATGHGGFRVLFGSDTRADAIMFGCLAALLLARRQVLVPVWMAVLSAMAFLGAALLHPLSSASLTVGLLVIGLASPILVLHAATAHSWITRVLAYGPVEYLGRISYGIYLWHVPVITAMDHYWQPIWYVTLPVVVVVTLPIAAASYHWVERPILRLKSRIAPSPVGVTARVADETVRAQG